MEESVVAVIRSFSKTSSCLFNAQFYLFSYGGILNYINVILQCHLSGLYSADWFLFRIEHLSTFPFCSEPSVLKVCEKLS